MAYGDAVAEIGISGHDEIGLNDDGFFGITLPRLDGFGEVLIGGRGLLVLTPVLAMAVVGTVIMYRRGRRPEALTIGAVALAYLLYNAAYWQPLGGGTPGPRFMTPVLPFLALGLAFAYRHRPATTLALAVPSLLWMLVANITYPLVGYQGSVEWLDRLADGQLEHTLLAVLGVESNWVALAPVVLAVAARGRVRRGGDALAAARPRDDLRLALAALGGWAVLFTVGPTITQRRRDPARRRRRCALAGAGGGAARAGRAGPAALPGLGARSGVVRAAPSSRSASGARRRSRRRRATRRSRPRPAIGRPSARPCGVPMIRSVWRTTLAIPSRRRTATLSRSGNERIAAITSAVYSGCTLERPLRMSGNPSVDQSR